MGKVEDVASLTAQNPRSDPAKIAIYADALADYRGAQANIDEHGTIVSTHALALRFRILT